MHRQTRVAREGAIARGPSSGPLVSESLWRAPVDSDGHEPVVGSRTGCRMTGWLRFPGSVSTLQDRRTRGQGEVGQEGQEGQKPKGLCDERDCWSQKTAAGPWLGLDGEVG